MINKGYAAALTTALALAGCTNDRPAPPSPTTAVACPLGQVRFGQVKKGFLLTSVSPPTTTSSHGGVLAQPTVVLHTRTAEVRAGDEVPHEYVYEKLAPVFGEDAVLPPYGTVYHLAAGERMTVNESGTFLTWDGLQTIDVPFTYECGGSTTSGTVATWRVTAAGGITCGKPVVGNENMRAALTQVALERC